MDISYSIVIIDKVIDNYIYIYYRSIKAMQSGEVLYLKALNRTSLCLLSCKTCFNCSGMGMDTHE